MTERISRADRSKRSPIHKVRTEQNRILSEQLELGLLLATGKYSMLIDFGEHQRVESCGMYSRKIQSFLAVRDLYMNGNNG